MLLIKESTKSFMEFYLNEVVKLEYESEPAYAKVQAKITENLASLGFTGKSDHFALFDKKTTQVNFNFLSNQILTSYFVGFILTEENSSV